MSKSLKLFAGSAIGTIGLLMVSVNFADRNIAPLPEKAAAFQSDAPLNVDSLFIAAAYADTVAADAKLGLGRPALPEEIAAWDLDVSPNGHGLPAGSGSVEDGEMLFSENCAVCHGEFAEGSGNWPKLAGGDGSLADEDPLKTVGSYWPHLSTAFDYVNRSMPFGNAQSLAPDEVYAIVAYILYSNFIVEDDFVLSKENFLEVEMPNAGGFFVDDREATEYVKWTGEPCMENCKESVEITMRATVLDVTPDEAKGDAEVSEVPAAEMTPAVVAQAEPTPATPVTTPETPDTAMATSVDPALIDAGKSVFKKCKACHQVGDKAKNRSGPQLNGIVGRDIGAADGFKYSKVFKAMEGNWTKENLASFLANPKGFAKGTKMAFAGLKKPSDIDAVIAYLEQSGQ